MRNWKKPVRTRGHTTKMYYHTGMTLRDSAGNVIETHVDRMYRRGIRLFPTIFIGGVRSDLVIPVVFSFEILEPNNNRLNSY